MRGRAVVALEEVLRADLPVRLVLRLGPLKEAQGADVDAGLRDPVGDAVEELRERRGVGVRVDEEEGAPRLQPKRHEAELVGLDSAFAVRPRRREEAAVEPVRPRVVRALQRRALAAALADHRASMPADVEEGAQHSLAVAHEDHRHVAHARRPEGSRLGELARVPDVLPRAPEDPLPLELEHRRIRVPAPRQRARAVHRRHAATLARARRVAMLAADG